MKSMRCNKSLERAVNHRWRPVLAMDCVLARAQWQRWPAAQLNRQAATEASSRMSEAR
jgi:hypothetical protein